MDSNGFNNKINKILRQTDIDERTKLLIKLYFLGKFKQGEITLEEVETQINTLCSRIQNVEFSSNNIVTAYSSKADVLTINKKLILEGKADEVILPVFMKFEEVLNNQNRPDYANHIENFINAGRIAKATAVPISHRLYRLYEMAEYCYTDLINNKKDVFTDNSYKVICSKYNDALNKSIILGVDDNDIINGANLFHSQVFSMEAYENPEIKSPFENEEYQKKAAVVIACIDDLDFSNSTMDLESKKHLIEAIKRYTGCNEEMINQEKKERSIGKKQISDILTSIVREKDKKEPPKEFMITRLQRVLDKKNQWDSRIKPYFIPFFIRSQKIYNWDIDEFQERLNQIDLYIDKICFKPLESIDIAGDTALDTIRFNSVVFLNKKGNISFPIDNVFFHEMGHNTDENKREGVVSKERIQEVLCGETGRFYEWTNTIFERLATAKKFYKKNDGMQLSEEAGYEPLAPLGSMLSCALGISEVEFAKLKDKGKDYEQRFMDKLLPDEISQERLKKLKGLFDKYNLDTFFSLKKKSENQAINKEFYEECIELMNERIEKQLEINDIDDIEEYRKRQSFFLKKMNFNYKIATKTNGFRFSPNPIIHDIGFCTDKLSKNDFSRISSEYLKMADFDFDNNVLDIYRTEMVVSKGIDSKKDVFHKTPTPIINSDSRDLADSRIKKIEKDGEEVGGEN